jgi:hypothetical protein
MTADEPASHNVLRPLVALVGAATTAIPPAVDAFATEFPEATMWNVLDDRLIVEALEAGGLTQDLTERMSSLISYALDGGANGVLVTCCMYSPVADKIARAVSTPVHASDDAAFEAVIGSGYSQVLLLSSLPLALADAGDRFDEFLRARELEVEVTGVVAESAFDKSVSGDDAALADALASAVRAADVRPDAVLLAQYSLARATDALAEAVGLPVIAGPLYAAAKMRAAILRTEP